MLTVDFDRLGLRPGERLLDLGAGNGRHAFEALRRGGLVTACDLSAGDLTVCNAYFAGMLETGEAPPGAFAASVQADAAALPFADGAFDRIVAAEVIEHVVDDEGAAAELARVLRPGGSLALTAPAWLSERVCWALSADYHAPAQQGGHLRVYTEVELRRLLSGAGLTPTGVGRAHALHTPYWWLRCAVGVERSDHPLCAAYHRALVWELTTRPRPLRWLERALDPLLAKSVVVYARKAPGGRAGRGG
ncbi:MAG: class I SAM-dependent methyltransferase [Acidimicrobiales bacterium]